jgi:hypothetical protein
MPDRIEFKNNNIRDKLKWYSSKHDGYMTADEKLAVENFIKENPGYQDEITSLKQSVLTADNIIFENKSSLYRLEEMEASLPFAFKQNLYRKEAATVVKGYFNNRRMIGVASVAAMLLLLLGYKIYSTNPTNTLNEIVQKKNKENINKNEQVIARIIPNRAIENKSSTKYKFNKIDRPERNWLTSENQSLEKETNFNQQETKIIEAVNNESDKAINTIASETTIQSITENNTASIIEHTNTIINNTNNQNEGQENYNKINTEDYDRSIYIANFEIDGDKLRGISRRLNAIFKKNRNEKQK